MTREEPRFHLSQRAKDLARVLFLCLVLVFIVGVVSVLRHVQEVDPDDVVLIEEAFLRSQQEHVLQVEGDTVLVYDRQGELVYETTTQDWRANRDEYTERFGLSPETRDTTGSSEQ